MQRERRPRVVLDSNVLISGTIGRDDKPPRLILNALLNSRFRLIVSGAILSEYHDVLYRPWIRSRLTEDDDSVDQLLRFIEATGILIESPVPVFERLRDASDAPFLAAAIAGRGEFLVTYDKHLQEMADDPEFASFRIIPAYNFLEQIT